MSTGGCWEKEIQVSSGMGPLGAATHAQRDGAIPCRASSSKKMDQKYQEEMKEEEEEEEAEEEEEKEEEEEEQ